MTIKTLKQQSLQHDIAALLAQPSHSATLEPKVLRAICKNLKWRVGALWLSDGKREFLRCAYFWRAPGRPVARFESASRSRRFKLGVGLPGRVWKSGRPAWIRNVVADANFPRFAAAAKDGLRGAFAFPVRVDGEVVAVMEFFSNEIKSPDRNIIQRLTTAGGQLGQFLERLRVKDVLLRERAILKAQLALSPQGVLVVDEKRRIVSFNETFTSMWGISDVVMKNKSDDEALDAVSHNLSDPRSFVARVRWIYRNRHQRSHEDITLKDGRIFERHSAPIFHNRRAYLGRVWYFSDITEQKRAALEHAASAEKYLKLFSTAASPIVIADAKSLEILDANKAAQRLYGYTPKEFLRLTLADLSPEPQKMMSAQRAARPGRTTRIFRGYLKRKDGMRFPAEISLSSFQAADTAMTICMMTDISDRISALEVAGLRHKAEIGRGFVANVSHELRTPTTAILGFAETLLNGAMKNPRRNTEFLKTIYRHASHLNHLIEDLLDLATLDAGKGAARRRKIDLTFFLADFLKSHVISLRTNGIAIRIDLRQPLFIMADETQLRRVLSNLLDNAAKYTPPTGRITVSLRAAADRAVLSVADSGIGISKKDLPFIFDRFHRADTALSNRIKGTGLGLALTKEIIASHGGSVWADSVEGSGSTFFVDFPVLAQE